MRLPDDRFKVQLFRPPVDDWYDNPQFSDYTSVPTQLCLLASQFSKYSYDVSVIDGLQIPLEKTIKRIDAPFVGVTDIFSSHENAMAILKAAKAKGATTVVGGPNVRPIAKQILKNHEYVDFVIIGEGESALPKLLDKWRFSPNQNIQDFITETDHPSVREFIDAMSLDTVPNLVYRKNGKITRTKQERVTSIKLWDLSSLVNWHLFDRDNALPLATIKGCAKAEESGRCSFCSIGDRLTKFEPKAFWEILGNLANKHGVTYFWEGGDTFIIGDYPQQLLRARPVELSDISLKVYSSPQQLTPEVIQTLVELNVRELFVGIETANNNLLDQAGKGYLMNDVTKAFDLLKKSGLTIHIPFVYGLPGETKETADKTYKFAKYLFQTYDINKMVVSPAIPLPGTALFRQLKKHPEVKQRYKGNLDNDDVFDLQALVRLQTEYFTGISYEYLDEKIKKTKDLLKIEDGVTSFGINKELWALDV